MQSPVTSDKPEIPWMRNLSSCVNQMKQEGFEEDFQVVEGQLRSFDKRRGYSPSDVRIVSFYRFEGESDPGDNTVLYVIETADGVKGTLVDGYGAYAGEEVARFIVQVEDIQKTKVSDLNA